VTTKGEALAPSAQGLFLMAAAKWYSIRPRVIRSSQINKTDDACTIINKKGDQECLLPSAE
jgi:hypothetical protein